ncbi:MAG: hypothetical protein AAB417_01240 [Patescibacteria group bacterium]
MEQFPQQQETSEQELRLKLGMSVRATRTEGAGTIEETYMILDYNKEKDEYLLTKTEEPGKSVDEVQSMRRIRVSRAELESLN